MYDCVNAWIWSIVYIFNPVLFLFAWFLVFFQDRVSLCSPGCPGTHSVEHAGLKFKNLPASASQVLELKACAITAWLSYFFSSDIQHQVSCRIYQALKSTALLRTCHSLIFVHVFVHACLEGIGY